MAINPNIKKKADDIRNKVYGREVRESLASGLEAISSDVVETVGRQDEVESQFQDVIENTTDKDVISAPEIINARNGEPNLKTRLDKEHQEVTAQLAQTMTQKEFDSWVATLLDGGPSIFMDTLAALNTTYPNGSNGVALVRETNPAKIYVWNPIVSQWQEYGDYQGIEVKEGSVKPQSLSNYIPGKNLLKRHGITFTSGLLLNSGGGTSASANYQTVNQFIEVEPGETYLFEPQVAGNVTINYYLNGEMVKHSLFRAEPEGTPFTVPDDANQIKVSFWITHTNYQIEKGTVNTGYDPGSYMLEGLVLPGKEVEEEIAVKNTITNITLKDLTPSFYKHWKMKDKDLAVILQGDSISTLNKYTTPREDAKYRPPLMIEFAYPSNIEEFLRWKGQEYRRFDVGGVFTENAVNKETKEYDTAWDWVDLGVANNKPAITRVLTGTNVSVSYTIPKSANRCDFIYRTDYLNAESASITINKGNGQVEVFDENSNVWTEANGFTYSAKEADELLTGPKGNLRKSIYQKRLKMRTNNTNNDGTILVNITNNGEGRLTYWGIQYSPLNHMIDFLAQARGGHAISHLEPFESWDIDEFKPDLFLFQNPVINHGINIADPSTNEPLERAISLVDYSNNFVNYLNKIKNKEYAPEIINWTVFFHKTSGAIRQTENKANYTTYNDDKFTLFDLFDVLQSKVEENDVNYIPLFNNFWEEIKLKSEVEGDTWYNIAFKETGRTANGITVDGTHLNDLGALYVADILKPIFIC